MGLTKRKDSFYVEFPVLDDGNVLMPPIQQMIFVWQPDHGGLFQAYRSMLVIRKQWLIYRYKDFDSANIAPDGPDNDGNAALNTAHVAIQPEEAKLNEVIERLRWLAVVSS